MKICFLARSGFLKVSLAIFGGMRKRFGYDVTGYFVTTNPRESAVVKKAFPDASVHETATFLREHWDEFTEKALIGYEEKYRCAPVWKYIYTDRFLINRDYRYAVKVTVGLFAFFERLFVENDIDIYFSETIATLQCYVAYLVGKQCKTRYFAQMTARGLDSTHHYILNDPYQGIVHFRQDYPDQEYTREEYERADAFLSDFEHHDVKPVNMQFTGQKPRLKITYAILPVLRFVRRFNPSYNDPYSYMYYESYKRMTDLISFYFRYQKCRKYYRKPDYDRKFVYYPLHYQPEASTIVCAQKYEKQLFFIDSWAKSLPADTVLYVKEHYAFLGHRDPHFYKELGKYPNVTLIDPWENSRTLMEKAAAVTTLTGTAGWEAMLLRKPVFIGGNAFFDNAPGVIKTGDIFDSYVDEIGTWKRPEREETLRYLCEYFRNIYPGCVYSNNPKTYEAENVALLVDSLWQAITEE